MLRVKDGIKIPDDAVTFYDGFLYIIYRSRWLGRLKVEKMYLDPEYTTGLSLAEIAKLYPNTVKVIYESWMSGSIFNYKNHPDGEAWELVGETVGFA